MGSYSAAQTWTWALHLAGVHGVPHWHAERAARDRVTSVVDVDVVISRSEGDVLHTAAAIFIVFAGYFGLWGPLDGQAQAPCASAPERETKYLFFRTYLSKFPRNFAFECDSSVPGLHSEAVGLVGYSPFQTWAKGADPGGITSLHHRHSEGSLGYGRVIVEHLDQMHSYTQRVTWIKDITSLCLSIL